MNRNQIILAAKCVVLLSVAPAIMYSLSGGAPTRHTGAPGDQTCAECHLGTPLNGGAGKVEITYSGGSTYTPGQRGRFTVVVNDSDGRNRWGFEVSPRLASSLQNSQAGTLHSVDGNTQVECEDGGTQDACRAGQPQFVTHTTAGTRSNRFEFEWTPPNTGAGEVRIYVAGNAANGNGSNSGDRIYTASLSLTESAGTGGGTRPAISEGGIADAFNFQRSVASNTWISIFGTNLATATRDWNGTPELTQGRLPMVLEGVSVTVNGKQAAVYSVSPGQVNFLAPSDLDTGTVQVVLRNAAGETQPMTAQKVDFLPALYAPFAQNNTLFVTAVDNASGAILGKPGVEPRAARAFKPGDIVQFYVNGLGPTNPAVATDRQFEGMPRVVNQPSVRIANVSAEIFGAVLRFPGLYQIGARIPEVPDGDQPIVVEVGGVRSPANVSITIQR